MSSATIFTVGLIVTLLCLGFVFLTAVELKRLNKKSPSDDGRWMARQ